VKGYGKVWTEERVINEILNCMNILDIDRMPTSVELKALGRNDLHLKISRTRTYSGWAEYLNIKRKESCSLDGQNNEIYIASFLESLGHSVEKMSTKHPYDLLVDNTIKIDVKTSNPYMLKGSRVHTFGLTKDRPTCDIYICIAFDEKGSIERTMVIPSHYLQIVTLCIGANSKYNRFIGRYDYIKLYSEFYRGVV
jgi:hypothetical protein